MNFIKKGTIFGGHHEENEKNINEYNRQKAYRQAERDRDAIRANYSLGGGLLR